MGELNREEAHILAEVLEVVYSGYPYAVSAWTHKTAHTGYGMGWCILLSGEADDYVTLRSVKDVIEHIREEVRT